jgi:hypothetical protein
MLGIRSRRLISAFCLLHAPSLADLWRMTV